MNEIDVPQLSVQVVTGEPAQDQHGQGFAAISATFEVTDPALVERLSRIAQERTSVTIRCAMVDVSGPLTRVERSDNRARFMLAVSDMVYRKPSGPRVSVRSRVTGD
jgi:hypothetical protein